MSYQQYRVPSLSFLEEDLFLGFLAAGLSSVTSVSGSVSGSTSSILAVDFLAAFLPDDVVRFPPSSPVSDFLARALFAGVFAGVSCSSARAAVDFRFLTGFVGAGS